MSVNRRTFPGIAQAWIARGDGKQKGFAINAKTLSVFCEIEFLGDVEKIITLGETCTIDDGNANIFHPMSEICSIAITNSDADAIHILNTFCSVVVSDP